MPPRSGSLALPALLFTRRMRWLNRCKRFLKSNATGAAPSPWPSPGGRGRQTDARRVIVACCLASAWWARPAVAAELSYLEGHTQPVYAVAWTADGSRIVSGSFDRTVKVWDRAAGTAVRTFADHSHLVLAVAVSADGKQLATAGLDKQIFLYEMPAVRAELELGISGRTHRLAPSADGRRIFTADDRSVSRLTADDDTRIGWTLRNQVPVPTRPEHVVAGLSADPGGNLAVAAIQDGELHALLSDANSQPIAPKVFYTPEPISAFAARQDMQAVAVGSPTGKVRLYRWPPAAPREIAIDLVATSLLAAPDDSWIAAVGMQGPVKLFNVADGKLRATLDHPGQISAAALNADGSQLATAGGGQVKIWSTADGKLIHATALGSDYGSLSIVHLSSPDRWLIGAGGKLLTLQCNLPAGQDIALGPAAPNAHAQSADGSLLAVADATGGVRVVQLADGAVKHTFSTAGSAVNALSFTSDGGRLVSGGEDGRVRLHHLASGGTLVLEGQGAPVTALDLVGRSNVVAVGDRSGQIKLWNLADGSLQRELDKQSAAIEQLSAYEERELYALVAGDQAVRRWELAQPSPLGASLHDRVGAKSRLGGDGSVLAKATDDYVGVHRLRESGVQLGLPLEGRPLEFLALSPTGSQLLLVHPGGTAHLIATGYPHYTHDFQLPAGVVAAYFAPSERTLTLLTADGHLRAQDLPRIGGFGGHTKGEILVAAGADAQHCFSAGEDGQLKFWNMATGMAERDDALPARAVRLILSPDRQRLAVGLSDGKVLVRSASDGAPQGEHQTHGSLAALGFSPDGQRLVSAGALYDAATGARQEINESLLLNGGGSAMLKDGQTWAVADNGKIQLWTTGSLLAETQAHTGPVTALAFSSRGGQLVSTGDDRQVVQWRTSNLTEMRRLSELPQPATRLAADWPGRLVVAATNDPTGGSVQMWQATDGQSLPTIKMLRPISAIVLSEDAVHLHVATDDGHVTMFRTADGARLESRTVGQPIAELALSADGRRLTALSADKIRQWDVAPWSPRLRLTGHTAHVYGLDFSPDGTRLASAGADNTVMLWNTADGANYATAKGHTSPVYAVVFRLDGQQLASAGLDRTIRLWNPADGAQQRELKEEIADGLYTLAYSRDGSRLASAGLARSWQEWDPTQDKPLRTISGHGDQIYRVAYNAAGTRLATIGYAGQMRIWNVADGNVLVEEQLPVPAAYCLAWSPDGAELALGTVDHRVVLVRVPEAAR